jgi:hypothetical protein
MFAYKPYAVSQPRRAYSAKATELGLVANWVLLPKFAFPGRPSEGKDFLNVLEVMSVMSLVCAYIYSLGDPLLA